MRSAKRGSCHNRVPARQRPREHGVLSQQGGCRALSLGSDKFPAVCSVFCPSLSSIWSIEGIGYLISTPPCSQISDLSMRLRYLEASRPGRSVVDRVSPGTVPQRWRGVEVAAGWAHHMGKSDPSNVRPRAFPDSAHVKIRPRSNFSNQPQHSNST